MVRESASSKGRPAAAYKPAEYHTKEHFKKQIQQRDHIISTIEKRKLIKEFITEKANNLKIHLIKGEQITESTNILYLNLEAKKTKSIHYSPGVDDNVFWDSF